MPGHEVFLELSEVSKQYGVADGGTPLAILREADLQVRRGEAVAIVGPSGSGKTTLLNVLGSLDRPEAGRVLLEGRDLATLDEVSLAHLRNRALGFVFQFHHLLPHLSALENVLVPTLPTQDAAARQAAPRRAQQLLTRVGLQGREHHLPAQLSGGERQRVAVVRALINQPKLVLADEPTGALDQRSARELGKLLRALNREEGVTLVVVTHSLDLAREMDRRLELVDGRLEERAP